VQWLLGAWVLALAAWDLRHRRITNAALLPAVVLVVGFWILSGQGPLGASPWSSILGATLSAAFWLPGWLLGRAGGGDLKLAAVLGALLGGLRALEAALITALLLGLVSAIVSGLRPASDSTRVLGRELPAAPALAAGFLVQLAGGPWWLTRTWSGG